VYNSGCFKSFCYHTSKALQTYAILHYAQIVYEQNASKIVKLSHQMTNICWKLKWLHIFWDTV